jgi:hypothetical protein
VSCIKRKGAATKVATTSPTKSSDVVIGGLVVATSVAVQKLFIGGLRYIVEVSQKMKILFRALLLFIAFVIALGVIKFLFFKLFFFALWVGAIVFLIWIVSAVVRRA